MPELTPEEQARLAILVRSAWDRFVRERPVYAEIRDYYNGNAGIPSAPADSEGRLCDIAKDAVDNVLPLVIDSLSNPLSVVGFRAPDTVGELEAWDEWQHEAMDARQAPLWRDANRFGRAYGFEHKGRLRLGSPLDSYAAYADAEDDFPAYGFTLKVNEAGPLVELGMVFSDATTTYDLLVASIPQETYDSTGIDAFLAQSVAIAPTLIDFNPHGFGHAPIFKFGDGNPEITRDIMRRQRSINSSVYNRDVCEEYAAFPQKALFGWDGTEAQKAKAGMTKVMAFADPDVRVQDFTAADLSQFRAEVDDKKMALAQAMQVSPALLVPTANMAADMIALANAPYARKLQAKQRAFGEDVERWLRARAGVKGVEVPDAAETVWDETEPRSYAAVIDGITKLAASGDKLTRSMVEDIPGWTTQKVDAFMGELQRLGGSTVLDRLRSVTDGADATAED